MSQLEIRTDSGKGYDLSEGPPDIFKAAHENDLEALEVALAYYNVNVTDRNGMTPLHYAAGNLSFAAKDRLLQVPGIDPTIIDLFGRTASYVPLEVYGSYEPAIRMSDSLRALCHPGEWTEFDPNALDNGF